MSRQTGSHTLLLSTAVLSLFALIACDTGSRDGSDGSRDAAQQGDSRPAAAGQDAAPPADSEPQRPVVAETLPYAEVDEELVYGHFVFPADMVDPLPGLIVIHEWWGLTDGVRSMADRFAAEGFIVLAIDLFGGRSTRSPAEARAMMVEVLENPESAEDNIRQAYQFLADSGQSPRIGVLGWDFGGGWALNTAALLPGELDAVVVYYGQFPTDEARLAEINAPVLGLFGANDRSIPVETVREVEGVLDNLGKNYEIEIYPNAKHAFADPRSPNYDAETAELAWARALGFLNLHLAVRQN